MFFFRVNRIYIRDNRESPRFIFFGPDLAEIGLMSFVTTEAEPFPDFNRFLEARGFEERRALAAQAVEQTIQRRILGEVGQVRDGQTLTFGDTGYVLYQAAAIPEFFDWNLLAYESDSDLRPVGEQIDTVVKHPSFEGFVVNLAQLAGMAVNPYLTAGATVARFAARALADKLTNDRDDLAGLLYMSLNRREHYPHGLRNKTNVWDLTRNMQLDYSLFGFED